MNGTVCMAGNFRGANFCGKSEKAHKIINFRGLKFPTIDFSLIQARLPIQSKGGRVCRRDMQQPVQGRGTAAQAMM